MLRIQSTMDKIVRNFASSSKTFNKCQRLEGRVAIVTASTQGIGYSIAQRLGQEGAKIVVSSRKSSNVDEAVKKLSAEGLEVSGVTCHVGSTEDRKKLFEKTISKYGVLDILVSNAAVNPAVGPVTDCPEAVWDKIFDVNVKSTFLLMKEAVPFLKKSKSPSIIIISSIAAFQPLSLLGVYSISKTALLALCKTTADELACEGIRVNCIAPGVIKTKFSQPFYESESAESLTLSNIPMQRLGLPEEIAPVAAFLASDDASYITGETIIAAGGMKSRL